jgi:hypothetical protein
MQKKVSSQLFLSLNFYTTLIASYTGTNIGFHIRKVNSLFVQSLFIKVEKAKYEDNYLVKTTGEAGKNPKTSLELFDDIIFSFYLRLIL